MEEDDNDPKGDSPDDAGEPVVDGDDPSPNVALDPAGVAVEGGVATAVAAGGVGVPAARTMLDCVPVPVWVISWT